jgi:hypothetical protein
MKFSIQLSLDSPPERVFKLFQDPLVFAEVSDPLLSFLPVQPQKFPNRYESGKRYVVQVCAFRVFVIGKQEINPIFEDSKELKIFRDNGRGLSGALSLISKFDHQMTLRALPGNKTELLDELEFRGGIFTPFLGITFFFFWKWRHFKLKRVAKAETQ